MVYHLRNSDRAKLTAIEPILFLSKCLSPAESGYWPTELEMAGIVWTIRKVHHMVRASFTTTVIWTDYSAIASIVKQTKLSSSSVDKLNLRLICASTYLSQFNIAVKHKAGRDHIIPDALSSIPAAQDQPRKIETAGETHAYSGTIVELSELFRSRLLDAYKEREWATI